LKLTESESPNVIYASRLRLLLATYIDFMLFGVVWEVALHFSGFYDLNYLFKMLGFVLFELLLYWRFGSPGLVFMSISAYTYNHNRDRLRGNPFKKQLLVDPNIYRRENWFTILLAVVMILEGSKQFVRWTMWTPPLPYFGFETTIYISAFISMALGVGNVIAGYLLLKLRRTAMYLTLSLSTVYVVSAIMSWEMWDGTAETMVRARRAFQGIPVRPGEVEIMQFLLPEAIVAVAAAFLLAVIFVRKRLQ
jgi:hypothetical protein